LATEKHGMSIYIDSSSYLHHDGNEGPTLCCPHCQAISLMSPVSIPRFSLLMTNKPIHVGVVFRCNVCNAPVFLKYPVKLYAGNRVELSQQFHELEHPREKLSITHLPSHLETLFKEALTCFTYGAHTAFALMCRHTTQAMFRDLGDNGRLKIFDLLAEARDLAGIDAEQFNLIKKIVFDNDNDLEIPTVTVQQAGMMLEVMRDLLYQCYTRRGKLQQAMKMRRFFAEQRAERNVERATLKVVT
jgi:hypothetical protein